MGWTIAGWKNQNILARKIYTRDDETGLCNDKTRYWGQFELLDEQPLQDESHLNLDNLYHWLKKINDENANLFFLRGKPFIHQNDVFSRKTEDFIDEPSKQFQLDLDFTHEVLTPFHSLKERVEIALDVLPFLQGKRFVAQLSSSHGIFRKQRRDRIEDYCRRLNLRLWVEAERAFTGYELTHYFAHWQNIVDLSLFQPTRIHLVLRGLINGKPTHEVDEGLMIYEG